jgi:drug/metabolite transporter (DMT)-like permease
MISPAVVSIVLFAALLHATWNALAHAVSDRLVGFALIGFADVVGGGVLILVGGLPSAAAWPYVITSAVLHVGYTVLLLLSYQLGEFSQVYPVARGVAPLVVAMVALAAGDLPTGHLVGVALVSGGLLALVFVGGLPGRRGLPALGAALLTGLFIASYTVVDAFGVRHGPLLAYIGWLFLLQGPVIPVVAMMRRRGRLSGLVRTHARAGLGGGVASLGAYGLVLWAQTGGALAAVAALRESSIVFGAIIGALFLGERLGFRRALPAGVVLLGVAVLSTS